MYLYVQYDNYVYNIIVYIIIIKTMQIYGIKEDIHKEDKEIYITKVIFSCKNVSVIYCAILLQLCFVKFCK